MAQTFAAARATYGADAVQAWLQTMTREGPISNGGGTTGEDAPTADAIDNDDVVSTSSSSSLPSVGYLIHSHPATTVDLCIVYFTSEIVSTTRALTMSIELTRLYRENPSWVTSMMFLPPSSSLACAIHSKAMTPCVNLVVLRCGHGQRAAGPMLPRTTVFFSIHVPSVLSSVVGACELLVSPSSASIYICCIEGIVYRLLAAFYRSQQICHFVRRPCAVDGDRSTLQNVTPNRMLLIDI